MDQHLRYVCATTVGAATGMAATVRWRCLGWELGGGGGGVVLACMCGEKGGVWSVRPTVYEPTCSGAAYCTL